MMPSGRRSCLLGTLGTPSSQLSVQPKRSLGLHRHYGYDPSMLLPTLLLLNLDARAECLERYDKAHRRTALTAETSAAATGLISAGSGWIILNALVMPAGGKEGNIYVLLLGVTVAGVAGVVAGGAATTLVRHMSVAEARSLLFEAQLGDGPALRAFAADLEATTGESRSQEEIAAALLALDQDEALCAHAVKGRRGVKRQLVRALE